MNKAPLHKHVKFVAKKSAKKMGVLQAARSISRENILKKSQLYFMGSYRQSPLISFFNLDMFTPVEQQVWHRFYRH